MNLGEMVDVARRDYLDDLVQPYLFPEAMIIRALNWAETEAARRARLLVDAKNFEASVDTSGETTLDERVIFVKRAKVVGAEHPLTPVLQQYLDSDISNWEEHTGTPRGYVISGESARFLLYPKPEAAVVVKLTVVRTPLDPMEDTEDRPEIPARFHDALLHGACYRLFARPDTDTRDDKKAALHLAMFEQEFGQRSAAIDETWIRENYSFEGLQGAY